MVHNAGQYQHYPLSIESVKKIKDQNRQGIKPEALETVEIVSGKFKEAEPAFVDVVGHISLKSLEKNSRKRRDNNHNNNRKPNTSKKQQQQNSPNMGQIAPGSNNKRNRPPRKKHR